MSKRFGRNQKRKLQEEVQHYKDALDLQGKLTHHLADKHDHDLSVLRKVRQVLGEYTAVLDPQIQCAEEPPGDEIRIAKMKTPPTFEYAGNDAISDYHLHDQVLKLLRLSQENKLLNGADHLEFRWNDGRVGYAISEQAMQNLPEDFLTGQIANEMAKMLVQGYKEKVKKII